MSFKLAYLSPDGVELDLLDGSDGGPFVEFETLSGFVGEFEDTVVQTPGVPGGRVDFRDRVVAQMSGAFTVVAPDRTAWRVVRDAFSSRRYGSLFLTIDGVQFWLPVRLRSSLPSPALRPGVGARVQVDLVSDGDGGGVWNFRSASEESEVVVSNWGDVPLWPEVVWAGAGGRVTLPSGVGFTLPAVVGEFRLPLARVHAGRVYNPDGVADREVSRRVDAVSEMVPVGETRAYRVPSGARLQWDVGVFDPWH